MVALAPPTDEPFGHEHSPQENDDHAYADEHIGENDSGAVPSSMVMVRQSGGWPRRFIALRCFNVFHHQLALVALQTLSHGAELVCKLEQDSSYVETLGFVSES